ncbi:MAG: alpha-L-fucosidase, partial [Streptosporangiaceae bacterium]|nr:alpha-L-fucosidase [Streptosporangiaceae bacterium]
MGQQMARRLAASDIGRRRFLAGAALGAGGLLAYPALSASGGSRRGRAAASSGPYQPTVESLSTHPLPQWYSDAKFGIFIHWGVYSVPAWAPVGREYAEWYWHNMDNPSDPTHQ